MQDEENEFQAGAAAGKSCMGKYVLKTLHCSQQTRNKVDYNLSTFFALAKSR